jgi:hypothetical protein
VADEDLSPGLYFTEPLPDDFRQGDIYRDVLHLMHSEAVFQVVRSSTGYGGREETVLHGPENPPSGGFHWEPKEAVVAEGQLTWGIVLTHDCEVENDDSKSHRLVGLLRTFSILSVASQQIILEGRNMGRFYLPAWDEKGLPETYVDLRRWTTLREDALPAEHRIASMTDLGRELLQAATIRYLTDKGRPAPNP